MNNRYLQCAAVLAFFSFSAVSGADEYHYNNILVGDRASGMGGAYTAVSDDANGVYYNPAGIAYATGKNLSASVNAYSVSSRTYKGVIDGQDWTRTSSTLLPNFFGIIQPIGKFKVGFSYAVPDSNQEDQDQIFYLNNYTVKDLSGNVVTWGATNKTINFNNYNNTTLFGPTIASQLADNFSVGATIYIHKRSTEAILNQTLQSIDKKNFVWNNAYIESDEWGARPIVGIMWAPIEKLSLGVTVAKTFIIDSKFMSNETKSNSETPGLLNISNETLGTISEKRKYPYQITAGVAFFPNSSLLLSGDLSYSSAVEYEINKFNRSDKMKYNAVINGALGAEYFLNKSWAVRGGLYTDFANTPEVRSDSAGQLSHIDQYGGSLTLSHFTKNTSITCGGSYKYGDGKSQISSDDPYAIQKTISQNWTLFVSSSFSY
jgi:long-chain fatty acid transport protein